MNRPTIPNNEPAPDLDQPDLLDDEDRPVDPDADDSLPPRLDVTPEVPVPDVIDQLRSVVFDDEEER